MQDINTSKIYGVEQFLQDIASASNSILLNKAAYETITVKGKVVFSKRYNKHAYITLATENDALSITARWDDCINFELPHNGSYIAFQGYPIIKPHEYTKSGLQVSLVGMPVEEYQPESRQDIFVEVKSRATRITLADWLANNMLTNLIVVGSETGINDVIGQIPSYQSVRSHVITVGNAGKFCNELDYVVSDDTDAIVITRGGDDASIKIFDQPELVNHITSKGIPFYTGIGHNKPHLLVEKHCDQAFPTPSAIGSAIESHLQHIAKSNKLTSTLTERNQQIKRLNNELEDLKCNDLNVKLNIDDLRQTMRKQANLIRLLTIALGFVIVLSFLLLIG